MATYTPTQLVRTATTPTASTTYFTSVGKTLLKNIVLANVTSSQVTVTLALAGISFYTGPIVANSDLVFDINQVLNNNDTITMTTGTANAIAIHVAGLVIT